jgi:hypothetical protein
MSIDINLLTSQGLDSVPESLSPAGSRHFDWKMTSHQLLDRVGFVTSYGPSSKSNPSQHLHTQFVSVTLWSIMPGIVKNFLFTLISLPKVSRLPSLVPFVPNNMLQRDLQNGTPRINRVHAPPIAIAWSTRRNLAIITVSGDLWPAMEIRFSSARLKSHYGWLAVRA